MATILLVDDLPEMLELYTLILEQMGYRVLIASDAESALAVVSQVLPDLVITDWNLPGMDGVELCRRMRLSPRLSGIPTLLHSAQRNPCSREPWGFLPKPCELEELQCLVTKLVACSQGAGNTACL